MKRILLISDTHSHIDKAMIKHIKLADEVWHAGDIGSLAVTDEIEKYRPLRAVYGNIDNKNIRHTFPLDNRFTVEGVSVWITHIAGYPNRYNERIRTQLKVYRPKLFICGHSHILKVMFDKKHNHLHLNPGAVGKYGIHKVRTMLSFDLEDGNIKNLVIIELEKR